MICAAHYFYLFLYDLVFCVIYLPSISDHDGKLYTSIICCLRVFDCAHAHYFDPGGILLHIIWTMLAIRNNKPSV